MLVAKAWEHNFLNCIVTLTISLHYKHLSLQKVHKYFYRMPFIRKMFPNDSTVVIFVNINNTGNIKINWFSTFTYFLSFEKENPKFLKAHSLLPLCENQILLFVHEVKSLHCLWIYNILIATMAFRILCRNVQKWLWTDFVLIEL